MKWRTYFPRYSCGPHAKFFNKTTSEMVVNHLTHYFLISNHFSILRHLWCVLDIALSREMYQLPLSTGTQQSWMTVYVSKKMEVWNFLTKDFQAATHCTDMLTPPENSKLLFTRSTTGQDFSEMFLSGIVNNITKLSHPYAIFSRKTTQATIFVPKHFQVFFCLT